MGLATSILFYVWSTRVASRSGNPDDHVASLYNDTGPFGDLQTNENIVCAHVYLVSLLGFAFMTVEAYSIKIDDLHN